ncbi:hypothetical protein HOLleu_16683 [Holothuria leucospilota]|uniref:Uncharacterized protein n=1 Tax=Holothuria leucospilota TaxID=206669 RepID=A0A9Q1C6R0_HOLLE|nr:hypothetical protein HOLleu_16683 [Holothuria leucospilota]
MVLEILICFYEQVLQPENCDGNDGVSSPGEVSSVEGESLHSSDDDDPLAPPHLSSENNEDSSSEDEAASSSDEDDSFFDYDATLNNPLFPG